MSLRLRYAFNVKDWKPTEAQWKLCLRCVQKEESGRCNRFYFVDDCKSSMVSIISININGLSIMMNVHLI